MTSDLITYISGKVAKYSISKTYENAVNSIRRNRLRVLHDQLRCKTITPEILGDDDMVHAAYCTIEAVLNTHEKEKIECFARIYDHAYENKMFRQTNGAEECINIIKDISVLEMHILSRIEDAYHKTLKKKNGQINHWDAEIDSHLLNKSLALLLNDENPRHISGRLIRLTRTGFIQLHYGTDGGFGEVSFTPLYWKFRIFLGKYEYEC